MIIKKLENIYRRESLLQIVERLYKKIKFYLKILMFRAKIKINIWMNSATANPKIINKALTLKAIKKVVKNGTYLKTEIATFQ